MQLNYLAPHCIYMYSVWVGMTSGLCEQYMLRIINFKVYQDVGVAYMVLYCFTLFHTTFPHFVFPVVTKCAIIIVYGVAGTSISIIASNSEYLRIIKPEDKQLNGSSTSRKKKVMYMYVIPGHFFLHLQCLWQK